MLSSVFLKEKALKKMGNLNVNGNSVPDLPGTWPSYNCQ